jgi:uncharacterized protein YaaN involved in tellurite resistance
MARTEKQSIEELTRRYQKLHTHKIETETNLKNAQKQLSELKQQALKEFGTDDVKKLQQKLQEMTSENEKSRADYQRSLESIETELAKVQASYDQDPQPAEA